MKDTIRKLADLTLTHVATFAFPLVFAVLCGRILGVHDFGVVSFYTALAAFLGVIIEFGFDWLGIREVSRVAHDPAQCRRLLWNVSATKLLICVLTSLVVGAALLWLRGQAQAMLVLAMVTHMVGFALDVSWYLRALERTRLLLRITAATRMAGIVVLWLAVTRPGDMAPALWSYAFMSLLNAAIGWSMLARGGLAGRVRPQAGTMLQLMRESSAIVFGNLCGSLLTNGGVALLGLTASPATVGAANLALRVKMAGQAALLPLKQLAFVRLAALGSSHRDGALRVGRIALAALLGAGVMVGVAIVFASDLIVRKVFLGEHPEAVALMMLLGLTVPVNAVAELLGSHCLIAFGHERWYALIVAVAALLFSTLLVGVLHGNLAYGWALLCGEGALALMAGLRMRAILRRSE